MAITTYSELQTAIQNWLRRGSDAVLTTARIQECIALCENRIAKRLTIRVMEQQIDLPLEAHVSGGTAGGSVNALTSTPSPAQSSYAYGDRIRVTAASNNTSAATINVSSLGVKNLRKGDGSVALEANDLIANHQYEFFYDGTQFRLVPFGGVPLPSRYLSLRRIILQLDPVRQLEYLTPGNFYARYVSSQLGRPTGFTVEAEHLVFGPRMDTSYVCKLIYYRRLAALSDATNPLLTNHEEIYLYGSLLEASIFLGNQAMQLQYATLFDEACDRIESADKKDRYAGPSPAVRSAVAVI